MFGFGITELLIILAAVVLIVGPKRAPRVFGAVLRKILNLKQTIENIKREFSVRALLFEDRKRPTDRK